MYLSEIHQIVLIHVHPSLLLYLSSRDALFKHSGPIWQIDWVVKEHSMGDDTSEILVSIGIDGRVLQWTIRKGFESFQLMKLKRRLQTKQNEKKNISSKTKQQQKMNAKGGKRKGQEKGGGGGNVGGGAIGQEAYISQHAPGMGFAFSLADTNV